MLDVPPVPSILIVDNQTVIAEALQQVLEATGQFKVAAATTLDDMRAELSLGAFDLVLFDYTLKEIKSIATLEAVVIECRPARLALFSHDLENHAVAAALKVGICGYVPKTLGVKSLIACIKLLVSGERYIPLSCLNAINSDRVPEPQDNLNLAATDIRMISMISEGKTNHEIGHLFGIPESRVKMMLRNLYAKLNASNRAHVVSIARSSNLI